MFNTSKNLLLAAIFTLTSSAAFAFGNPHHNNNSDATANAGAISGAAAGAAVLGSGNSSNSNTNKVLTNQSQGQHQGQGQGQMQGIIGSGNSHQGQAQSTDNANNSKQKTEVNIEGSVYEDAKNPVNTAVGGQVGATGGGHYQCLVPISAGGQGMSVGLSFGSSTRDDDCVILQLIALNKDGELHTALSCQIPEYKIAMESIGRACPNNGKPDDKVATRYIKDKNGRNIIKAGREG